MPTMTLPLTTYLARNNKPGKRYGSPELLQVATGAWGAGGSAEVYARVPIRKIPEDAIITNAELRVYTRYIEAQTKTLRVQPITGSWGAGITWNKRPSVGPILDSVSQTAPTTRRLWSLDVTDWAITRNSLGLSLSSNATGAGLRVFGSSSKYNAPTLVVTYIVPSDQPGNLAPDGGITSSPKPVLSYTGEEDMIAQQVQFSYDEGDTIAHTSAWITATEGRYLPPAASPSLTSGQKIYWRVKTQAADGFSDWSDWAEYTYVPLPTLTITNPPAVTNDGSPVLTWTASAQQSWRAEFWSGASLLESTPWRNEPATRSWMPTRAVKTPGGNGRFLLHIRDAASPRVVALGSPTWVVDAQDFVTEISGDGLGVNTANVVLADPVATVVGSRAAGVPDEIALYRNGVQVPLWDAQGTVRMWAPGADFFNGSSYSLPDFTAPARKDHGWTVRTRVNGVVSGATPVVRRRLDTESVWLVDPRTGDRVEITGLGDAPAVEQVTAEESIVHLPINRGIEAEHIRRRLVRATKAGTITGVVGGCGVDDEPSGADILEAWANDDSGLIYRLIFGRVNWPVILGDYNPQEQYFSPGAPDLVSFTINWWQRRSEF